MLSFRLSERMQIQLSLDEYVAVEDYVNSLSYQDSITVARASTRLSLDWDLTGEILHDLVRIEVLQSRRSLRCPNPGCNHLIKTVHNDEEIAETVDCTNCDTEVEVDSTDVETIFFLLRNSEEVAEKYPDKYSLLTVEKVYDYGISQGRLLHVADSVAELNHFVATNDIDAKTLHYVFGDNII